MSVITEPPRIAGAWGEARHLVRSHWRALAVGFAFMVCNRVSALVAPASSKFLIDDVVGAGRAELLLPLAATVGGAILVQAGTSFGLARVVSLTGHRVVAQLRRQVQRQVVGLPASSLDSRRSGELVARIMKDAEGASSLIGTALVQLAGGLLTAMLALAVLIHLNVHLTAATLGVVLVYGAALAYSFRKLRPLFRERREAEAAAAARLTEALGGLRVIKAYTAERREARVFARGIHRVLRLTARSVTGHSAMVAFAILAQGTAAVLLIVLGGRALLAAEMTVGELIMFVFFLGLLAAPMLQVATIAAQLGDAMAGLERVRELRELTTEAEADRTRAPVRDLAGEVVFEDVSFAYAGRAPVLERISFRARPGSLTALVGPSGAGKTTLVDLLIGFRHPSAGRVLVDGRDLAGLRLLDYRAHIAAVLQEDVLFDGTIAENIAFGRPGSSPEAIREAGRAAQCDEFVDRFPDGFETVIGERGIRLSAGQRQRVSIARAILADPRILVLDEAMSDLDSGSEALVRKALRELWRDRTTFVIAHRFSTIADADRILVLNGGEIVERGTHEELIARGGRYRELLELQGTSPAMVASGEIL